MKESNNEKVAVRGIVLATICGILFYLMFVFINGGF